MAGTIQVARKGLIRDEASAKKRSKVSSDKVTKATKTKRGKGRGKPRAGRRDASKQPPFPFMRLPPELRDYVYKLALPHQELPNSGWATMAGTPNKFMNLLLVNKQISAKARKILYGLNTFTMVISRYRSSLLGSFDELDRKPIQAPPSISYIKNWQLSLWPSEDLLIGIGYRCGNPHEKDALLSACSEIAKVDNLQSLKLSIPCFCSVFALHPFDELELGDFEDVHDNLADLLLPLDQFRFAGQVQIMTTCKPPSFPEEGDKKGYAKMANTHHHQQCPEPNCQTLAASFEYVRTLLMSKTTPNSLTPHQSKWLNLRDHVAECGSSFETGVTQALRDTWYALESGSDEFFREMVWRVEEQLRLHRNTIKRSVVDVASVK